MKWLERLRAKTAAPTGDALTKLTKVSGASSVSLPSGGAVVVSAWQDPSLKTPGCAVPTGYVTATRSSPTAPIRGDLDRTGKVLAGLPLVGLRVSYQRIWYDFNVADGAYTPAELRRARKVVKPWGPVQDDTLP